MDNYSAIGIAEGWIEAENQEDVLQAWQHLIDTGQCWQLQGWFGRTATYLIQEGRCKLPEASNDTLEHVGPLQKNE